MTITADLVIPAAGASGVILTQGGRFGGWCLYMEDGKPVYTYNFLGLERYTIRSKTVVPVGSARVVAEFAYDGKSKKDVGKGGKVTLSINGKKVAEGRVEKTQPLIFSADETADVGLDNQTPVADDIGIGRDETRFTGKIRKITLLVKYVKWRLMTCPLKGAHPRNGKAVAALAGAPLQTRSSPGDTRAWVTWLGRDPHAEVPSRAAGTVHPSTASPCIPVQSSRPVPRTAWRSSAGTSPGPLWRPPTCAPPSSQHRPKSAVGMCSPPHRQGNRTHQRPEPAANRTFPGPT